MAAANGPATTSDGCISNTRTHAKTANVTRIVIKINDVDEHSSASIFYIADMGMVSDFDVN